MAKPMPHTTAARGQCAMCLRLVRPTEFYSVSSEHDIALFDTEDCLMDWLKFHGAKAILESCGPITVRIDERNSIV